MFGERKIYGCGSGVDCVDMSTVARGTLVVWGSGIEVECEGRKDLQVEFPERCRAALGVERVPRGALIGDRFLSGIVGKEGRTIGQRVWEKWKGLTRLQTPNAQCRTKNSAKTRAGQQHHGYPDDRMLRLG